MKKIAIWSTRVHQIQEVQKLDLIKNYKVDEIVNISDLNLPFQNLIDNSPVGKENLKNLVNDFINYILNLYKNDFIYIVQPAGSPAFQFVLGSVANNYKNVEILYAHSERVSEDVVQPDGTIKKISSFKHVCFE